MIPTGYPTHTSLDNCVSLLSMTEDTREDDLSHMFAICEVLSLFDIVPDEWEFTDPTHRSKEAKIEAMKEQWPDSEWLDLLSRDHATVEDLTTIGNELMKKIEANEYTEV